MTLEERFWSKVRKADGDACWAWTGAKRSDYGAIKIAGDSVLAHRVAWELTNGPIPEGQHVLHRCDNPPCVNPSHLFTGSHADNMRDAFRKGRVVPPARNPSSAAPPPQTHCKRGHPLSGDNVRLRVRAGRPTPLRVCRACRAHHKGRRFYVPVIHA